MDTDPPKPSIINSEQPFEGFPWDPSPYRHFDSDAQSHPAALVGSLHPVGEDHINRRDWQFERTDIATVAAGGVGVLVVIQVGDAIEDARLVAQPRAGCPAIVERITGQQWAMNRDAAAMVLQKLHGCIGIEQIRESSEEAVGVVGGQVEASRGDRRWRAANQYDPADGWPASGKQAVADASRNGTTSCLSS